MYNVFCELPNSVDLQSIPQKLGISDTGKRTRVRLGKRSGMDHLPQSRDIRTKIWDTALQRDDLEFDTQTRGIKWADQAQNEIG